MAIPEAQRTAEQSAAARTGVAQKSVVVAATKSRVADLRARTSATKRLRRTKKDARLACAHARTVDLVEAMVTSGALRAELDRLSEALTDATLTILVPALDKKACSAVADHFWCEVLAQLADALDGYEEPIGEAAGEIAEPLASAIAAPVTSQRGRKWAHALTKPLIEKTVKHLLSQLITPVPGTATVGLHLNSKTCRLLALMMCPDPEKHPLVYNTCLLPYLREEAAAPVQQQLLTLVPSLLDRI